MGQWLANPDLDRKEVRKSQKFNLVVRAQKSLRITALGAVLLSKSFFFIFRTAAISPLVLHIAERFGNYIRPAIYMKLEKLFRLYCVTISPNRVAKCSNCTSSELRVKTNLLHFSNCSPKYLHLSVVRSCYTILTKYTK